VREAHAVVVAMHRLAVTEAVARLTDDDVELMRAANRRFAAAIEAHDADAALTADDDFHRVAVEASGNRALATVLDQFGPVVRRLERRRFASHAGEQSVALHERLVEACAGRDAGAAADVASRTWQNLADLIPDADRPAQQEIP
jgi:DNA-binding GntR family transcriptional regulator